ncbi:MAG: hypothetical protein QXV52_03360 [Nitrososphaeria archaeon]
MNRLFRFEDPKIMELFDKRFISSIFKKVSVLEKCVSRVEEASGLRFPEYYIEPILPVYFDNSGGIAVYYARTIPYVAPSGLDIVIQVSAAMLKYGSKSSIEAILAHEFLHYLDLVRRISKFEIVSDEVRGSVFETLYSDLEKIIKPEYVYADRKLVRTLKKKFADGFEDEKLKEKTLSDWINKGKPIIQLSPEENMVRIPVSTILASKFDPILLLRIREIEKKAGLA